MILQSVFNIVSHFKFEIGAGMVNLGKIEDKLNSLSKATQGVSDQFKYMFASSALSLTGGSGGILGVLSNAVTSSEEFYKVQKKLSVILTGNAKSFKNPLVDFNENLKISKSLIESMVKEANKFGIPTDQYVDTFTQLSALMIPKGSAGKNLENAKNLSKNLIAGSNVLGMSPQMAKWQATTLIEGQLQNPNQTLWRRLKAETKAFKNETVSSYNNKSPNQRVQLLIEALEQFTEKSGVLEAHLNSLSTQMVILRNNFSSMGSILRPLGDALRGPFIKGLRTINTLIGGSLSRSIKLASTEIIHLTSNLERLFISLEKMSTLQKSFNITKKLSGLLFVLFELKKLIPTIIKGFGYLLGIFGIKMFSSTSLVGKGFNFLKKTTLGVLGILGLLFMKLTKTKTILGAFAVAIKFLGSSLLSYFKIFLPVLTIMRIIETAKIKAQVLDMKNLVNGMDKYTEKIIQIKDVMADTTRGFSYIVDEIANLLAPLFSKTTVANTTISIFNSINESLDLIGKHRITMDTLNKTMIALFAITESYITFMFKGFGFIFDIITTGLGFISKGFKMFFEYLETGLVGLYKVIYKIIHPFSGSYDDMIKKKKRKKGKGEEEEESIWEKAKKKVVSIFDTGFTGIALKNIRKHWAKYDSLKKQESMDKTEKATNIINIGKVEIKNQFKENLNPARVAIAIKDVLTNAVQSPTGTNSRDNTYTGGVGGGFSGGF